MDLNTTNHSEKGTLFNLLDNLLYVQFSLSFTNKYDFNHVILSLYKQSHL